MASEHPNAYFRVWQVGSGERAAAATIYAADNHEDAVEHVHALDWEGGDEHVYCVQAVRFEPVVGTIGYKTRVYDSTTGNIEHLEGWVRGGKVHVVQSLREAVPKIWVSQVERADLVARCPGCDRRMLDIGQLGRKRCRNCSVRDYARGVARRHRRFLNTETVITSEGEP